MGYLHINLRHVVSVHPHAKRFRQVTARRLAPVRPSHADELFYRAKLRSLVNDCRAAGADIGEALRPLGWPRAADAAPPTLAALIEKAAAKFQGLRGPAERLGAKVAQLTLKSTDERLKAAIQKSVGVNIEGALSGEGRIAVALREAAEANANLITSIPAQYLEDVRDTVTDAWESGLRFEEVIGRIKHVGEVTDYRAYVIARDQTGKMNAAFNQIRQTDLGIEEYTWAGAMDQRERASHRAMEGVRVRWDSPPLVDGENVHAGQAVMCRCVSLPILKLVDDEEIAA